VAAARFRQVNFAADVWNGGDDALIPWSWHSALQKSEEVTATDGSRRARRWYAMTDREVSARRGRLGAGVGMLARRFEEAVYAIAFLLLAAAAILVVIGTVRPSSKP